MMNAQNLADREVLFFEVAANSFIISCSGFISYERAGEGMNVAVQLQLDGNQ